MSDNNTGHIQSQESSDYGDASPSVAAGGLETPLTEAELRDHFQGNRPPAAHVYADLAAHAGAARALIEHAVPSLQRCVRLAGELPLEELADAARDALELADLAVQLHDRCAAAERAWTADREASSVGGGA